MDARVRRFREEVSRRSVGGVGRRYPAELRAVAITVARERRSEPLSRVAADLGVSTVSLQRWLERNTSLFPVWRRSQSGCRLLAGVP